jgi:hypothetical protein
MDCRTRVLISVDAGTFLFTTTFTLGPTQPPTQWVPGALPLGLMQTEHKVGHLITISALLISFYGCEVRNRSTSYDENACIKMYSGPLFKVVRHSAKFGNEFQSFILHNVPIKRKNGTEEEEDELKVKQNCTL